MEKEYRNNMNGDVPKYTYNPQTLNIDHPDQEAMKDSDNTNAGKVFLQNDWRDLYYGQASRTVQHDGKDVDPPVCVYVPNVGGRVIEVRVEPEESGSQVCV